LDLAPVRYFHQDNIQKVLTMGRGYMTKTEKLAQLYKKANGCNEDLPAELMNKLSLYGQILEIIGGLHAEAVGAWKLAEAYRRETLATVYSLDPEGSNKDRENKAEMAATQSRRDEAKAEQEATRWKNAYNSTNEQINIMKKRYDHLVNVFQKGGI
jgi:hypothetical protein